MTKKITCSALSILLAILICSFLSISALAQDGATTPGPVSRVTLYKVAPGKMDDVIKDMREHLKPLYDEYQKQGLIVSYGIIQNSTTENADDWSIGQVVSFKDWTAFGDFNSKTAPISLKHYGSAENRAAIVAKRNQMRTVVSSRLMRSLILNPIK